MGRVGVRRVLILGQIRHTESDGVIKRRSARLFKFWRKEMKKRESTGLLDKNMNRIFTGDWILSGMRRGDPSGWSKERVVRKRSKLKSLFMSEDWCDWCLVNELGETMDMQLDQELRELIL
jgi:hypothetical protein